MNWFDTNERFEHLQYSNLPSLASILEFYSILDVFLSDVSVDFYFIIEEMGKLKFYNTF